MPFENHIAQTATADQRKTRNNSERGYTLVELLAAISIIVLLLAFLLPAINAARQKAQQAACLNRLRQCGAAVLVHLEHHRHFPTGGWGERWVGIPSHGYGKNQPGGWVYNILPFVDQQALRDLGFEAPVNQPDEVANARRLATPLALLHCPSRRGARLYSNRRKYHYCEKSDRVARCDFAINGGHQYVSYEKAPTSLPVPPDFSWKDMAQSTGISFLRSQISMTAVPDGASNTYLLAEKHVPRSHYASGEDMGDNETMYSGDDRDIVRYTGHWSDENSRPVSDRLRSPRNGLVFGSAHPHGFNATYCDGSTHHLRFNISQVVHSRLGRRNDRQRAIAK